MVALELWRRPVPKARLALGTAMALFLTPGLAKAQDAEGNSEELAGEDVIIVTAQKREQRNTDVGLSISVVGATEIAERRIDTATDIAAFTPNVSVKENIPGLVPVITIRGVGLNDFSATNNPSAGVYVDEVSLSSLALMNFDMFDIQQIEVLKGPQGTLYGRNSTAGALVVRSAAPKLGYVEGRVSATLASYKTKEVDGMVNVPLGSDAALRVAGKGIFQDEGFYYNRALDRDIGRREVLLGRAQLLYDPGSGLDFLLKVEGQRGRSELGQPEFFGLLPTAPPESGVTCPGSPFCTDFFGYRDTDGDPFSGDWSVNPDYNVDQLNLTGKVNIDLGFATLTSVTGFIDFDRTWGIDVDGTPFRQTDFITNDDVTQFSQELRLGGATSAVDWVVGAFYSRDRVKTSYDGDLRDLFNTTTLTSSNQLTKSAALFAHGEWSIASDLSLVTGLRFTHESRSNVGSTVDLVSEAPGSFLTLAPLGTPPIPLATVDEHIEDDNWSWRLGLNWKVGTDSLVYASVSQGVKSGGFFAGVATNSGQLVPYDPERLVSFELGAKGVSRDTGLSYDISAFYYDYHDVQTFIRDVVGTLPIQRLGNVDKAEIYGVDADFQLRPKALPGLELGANIGLLHTELGSFDSSGGLVPAGNRLPDAPKLSFGARTVYEASLGGPMALRFGIDGRYQSLVFKDGLNDPLIASDGFWIWNARLSLVHDNGWDLSFWGENLDDKHYVSQGVNQLPLGTGNRNYGAPRTYGVTLSKDFR